MFSSQPVRAAGRRVHRIVAVLVAGTVLCGLVGCGSTASPSPFGEAESSTHERIRPQASSEVPADPPGRLQPRRRDSLGTADGEVPTGVTVFDDRYPAVTNLDPALLGALRRAATVAEGEGVEFYVSSGWRSEHYQEQLFAQAVEEYGSETEAARWVARPGKSVHEAGGAVDIGPDDAQEWLSEHGANYGLCQVYDNEPWHYELRPDAVDRGCPARYADPSHDPRTQQ